MTDKPRFEASADVEKCVSYLRKNKNAGTISYADLSKATGRDIAGKDRYILTSARRILERDGLMFATQTGKGVILASDVQKAEISTDGAIVKTRRIAKLAKKRQRSVNIQNLTDEQRMAFWVGSAILGAIDQAASRAFKNRVEEDTKASDMQVTLSRTLELFANVRPNKDTPH